MKIKTENKLKSWIQFIVYFSDKEIHKPSNTVYYVFTSIRENKLNIKNERNMAKNHAILKLRVFIHLISIFNGNHQKRI